MTHHSISTTIYKNDRREGLLVAVVFEVFLVAVVLKHVLRVVFPKPLCLVDVKRAGLGFHFLALSAPWDWC